MSGQRIGYIRVSTLDQHTERQLDGIELDKTFIDKVSGKDTKRPQLELLMSLVRSGPSSIGQGAHGVRCSSSCSGCVRRTTIERPCSAYGCSPPRSRGSPGTSTVSRRRSHCCPA